MTSLLGIEAITCCNTATIIKRKDRIITHSTELKFIELRNSIYCLVHKQSFGTNLGTRDFYRICIFFLHTTLLNK